MRFLCKDEIGLKRQWMKMVKFFFECREYFLESVVDNCNWFPSDGSDEDPIYGLWFKLDRWKSMFGAHCEYLTSPLPQQLFVIIMEEM